MATLTNVIETLKAEGHLSRNSGTNSIKSVKELMVETTNNLIDAFTDTIEVFGQQLAMHGALAPIQEEETDKIPGEESGSKEEEDKREERKIFQRLIDTMEGVGKSMESLSDSILDTVGKAGKAAGIATLLALFIKPELAFKVIEKAINVFNDGLTAIGDLMSGSTEGLTNFIQNHPIVTGVGTTLLVVKLVGVVGSLFASIAGTLTTIGATIGGIVSGFTTVAGVLTGITGLAIGPLIAAIAGIGLLVYGLVNAFSDAFKVWDETGSALETLKAFWGSLLENTLGVLYDLAKGAVKLLVSAIGSILSGIFSLIKNAIMFTLQLIGESIIAMFANIVGFFPNLLKSLVSSIVGFLGFDELEAAIDDFDFVQFVKDGIYGLGEVFVNTLLSVFDYISEIPSKILDYIKSAASKIPIIGGLFSDDEEETSATEKKLTVTTKDGETKQLTQEELVDAVSRGEVSEQVAKTAIQDSKKITVTTKDGKTKQLTQSELVDAVSRGEVSEQVAKTAISSQQSETISDRTTERKVGGIVVERNGESIPLTADERQRVQAVSDLAVKMGNKGYDVSQNPSTETSMQNVSVSTTNVSETDTNTTDRVFTSDPYTAKEGEYLTQEQMTSLFSDNENSNVVSLSDVGRPSIVRRSTEQQMTGRKVGGVPVEINGKTRADFSEEELKKINSVRSIARSMGNPDPFPQAEGLVSIGDVSEVPVVATDNAMSDRVFSIDKSTSTSSLSKENLSDNNRVALKENTKSSESFFSQIGKSVSNMISTGLQSIPIIGDLFKTESTADTSIENNSGLSSSSNVISMKDYKASVANGGSNVNLSRNYAADAYTAREGEYLTREQMTSILGGSNSESNRMQISSVESPITSLYKTTQAENTALSSQSSSTAEQTVAAIAPMIAALGVGGGSSNRTNNNISNTSVTNNFSPDTLSREFIYRPA